MYLDRYQVSIINPSQNSTRRTSVEANTPQEAHKKVFSKIHDQVEEIVKITDFEKNIVYTNLDGFLTVQE